MIFYILKNIYILSSDTFIDFSLELTIHKVGELGINLKIRNPVRKRRRV